MDNEERCLATQNTHAGGAAQGDFRPLRHRWRRNHRPSGGIRTNVRQSAKSKIIEMLISAQSNNALALFTMLLYAALVRHCCTDRDTAAPLQRAARLRYGRPRLPEGSHRGAT